MRACAARPPAADKPQNKRTERSPTRSSVLRGLDGSGLHHHLDLVLGAREQLDGPALAEPGPVHLEEHGPLVRLDPQRDGDVDDGRNVVHGPGLSAVLRFEVRAEDSGGCGDAEEAPEASCTVRGFLLSFKIRPEVETL